MALSERQQHIYEFLTKFTRENGRPPTIREIGGAMGISSISVVNYNLNILVREGLIAREEKVSRGLRIIRTNSRESQSTVFERNRIFLCHASEDKRFVHEFYKELSDEGFYPWLDEEDLLPGANWEKTIERAISKSRVVIVCLSKRASSKTGYIQKEIKIALDIADLQPEGTIFIIPARIEECNVPERLRHLQWVDLFDKRGLGKLKRALRHALPVNGE